MKKILHSILFFSLACFFSCSVWAQVTITIAAQADNTIFQERPINSNGGGQYLFAGNTLSGDARRALLKFNLAGAGIPAGTIFLSASLSLTMNRSIASASNINLHKSMVAWGEGASAAGGQEGTGTLALVNDATWPCSFSNGGGGCISSWTSAGGDFNSTPSATTSVGPSLGNYTWSSTQLLADVQGWFNTASTNFGWILIGDETAPTTANRFASRENNTVANRPTLTLTYTTLPVSLISFTGEETKNGNSLFWKTSQEISNSFFSVQHSLDGNGFSDIGKINGNRNSSLIHSYSFNHNNIGKGKNFYRLAQTDFDGRIKYSPVVLIENKNDFKTLYVFPNPVANSITLNGLIFTTATKYVILNELGKNVSSGFLINNSVDVESLPAGLYFIKVYQKDNSIQTVKFLKQ